MKYYNLTNSFVFSVMYIFILSCDKEFYPVGIDLFSDQTLNSNSLSIPVYTFQKKINSVQADGLPLAQLGSIKHPVFGLSEASITTQLNINNIPIFGNLSQSSEQEGSDNDNTIIPENEIVKNVYLEIPFFTNQNDKDNDGVIDSKDADPENPESNSDGDELTDIVEFESGLNPLSSDSDNDGILDHEDSDNSSYDNTDNFYQVDSLYGNLDSTFNLKVHELTYYLNSLDANNNFETNQNYFSNQDFFKDGFYGEELHNSPINLNFDELIFYYKNDDPLTVDVDETKTVETRLTPRIRVPLSKDFFQKRVIDIEGSSALENATNFRKNGLRGLIIQTENFSKDLYMLLNINSAEVKIEYEYDSYNSNDGTIDQLEKTYSIPVGGITLNTLKNSMFDNAINRAIENSERGEDSDKLFIQSGKFHGIIRMFSKQTPEESLLLNDLRNKSFLINEASISFYLDKDLNTLEELLPQRLYLYDISSGQPIFDYIKDQSVDLSIKNGNKNIFGGILELDDSNKPYRYKFNITDHISTIIRRDSTSIDLGLVANSNIMDLALVNAIDGSEKLLKYPRSSIINPLGVILIGSNNLDENLLSEKVQLELTYTEY
jgi:hypothetical protein